jgi:uncharacterized protein (DUF1697 family)
MQTTDVKWVALLRAVNLGPRNRVPMAELRALFGELGFDSVATYIASGNVVFAAGREGRETLRRRIEAAVAETFGVSSTVVLRNAKELDAVLAAHPFGADTSRTAVTFLAAKPAAAAARRLAAVDAAPEELKLVGSEVYVRYAAGIGQSRLTAAFLERQLGVDGTARNWRTVTKLAELAA